MEVLAEQDEAKKLVFFRPSAHPKQSTPEIKISLYF